MPSNSIFDQQDGDLPGHRAAGRRAARRGRGGRDRWLVQVRRLDGAVVGIDSFGECGPAGKVFEFLGITAAKVAEAVEGVIA